MPHSLHQPTTKLFIGGKFVDSATSEWVDVHNPVSGGAAQLVALSEAHTSVLQATNEVVTRVPCATHTEMAAAVEAAEKAFPSWAEVSILSRQRVMFNLQHLIREKMSELAQIITAEQGKTLADAEGDVLRGLREWAGL